MGVAGDENRGLFQGFERSLQGQPMIREDARRLARLMEHDIHARDAILLVCLCGMPAEQAADYAACPDRPECDRLLDDAWNATGNPIGGTRVVAVRHALQALRGAAPETTRAATVEAYLDCYMGDTVRAERLAIRILERNPRERLAAIVLLYIGRNVRPAFRI